VHVLIEKPIAPTLEAADRILEAAAGAGVLVQIGHVERFNAALRACEPYLDEPLFVESHRLAPFGPRGTDVAVVLDLMIHDLDLVLSLMKRPVSSLAPWACRCSQRAWTSRTRGSSSRAAAWRT
jgi:predicted dehydrogenase